MITMLRGDEEKKKKKENLKVYNHEIRHVRSIAHTHTYICDFGYVLSFIHSHFSNEYDHDFEIGANHALLTSV
jgi:hypothetical protein